MSDPFDLTGRRALVTGASRGIGLTIAGGLARRGAAVAITGRKADALDAAAASLRAASVSVLPLVCHQGDPAAIAGLFQALDGRMLPHKKGSLIFISSVAGLDPVPGLGAYGVSKAGLLGLMRGLARELGPGGVRVNALAPELIETRFSAALFQDQTAYDKLIGPVALGRHGQPDDLVGAAVFLASDASAYLTGQVLVVDGGGRM